MLACRIDNQKGDPMNSLCWRGALLACALFSGGLVLGVRGSLSPGGSDGSPLDP
jgi:hypothetical protein